MSGVRFFIALAGGKISSALLGAFAPKRGSNLPGAIALKLDPGFLRHVKGIDPAKTIFITGTNGKSTSNNMIAHAFKTAGRSVCSNLEGANMKPGIATALIANTTAGGRFKKDYLVLEIDERSLAQIAKDLKPGRICVTNIQKDQVQRNGDTGYIYKKIKDVVENADNITLYVNNEEPRSKSLGNFVKGSSRVVSFGVAENARGFAGEPEWEVTMPCPLCGDALAFTWYNLAGVGAFRCETCGFSSGGPADSVITEVDYAGGSFRADGELYKLVYPAAFFLYNYALCLCVCQEFGIDSGKLKEAFSTFENIGGRMESFSHSGKIVKYTRVKQENPETLQSALDTIAVDKEEKAFVFGPDVISDIIPHYSNTFYTFDCNFHPLITSGVERFICFGKTVALDAANRLRYSGVPDARIEVLDTDDDGKILGGIAALETDNVYLIAKLMKYEKLKGCAR